MNRPVCHVERHNVVCGDITYKPHWFGTVTRLDLQTRADYIAKAVNHHDELVAMLTEIVAADDEAVAHLKTVGFPISEESSALTERARALIQKVTP